MTDIADHPPRYVLPSRAGVYAALVGGILRAIGLFTRPVALLYCVRGGGALSVDRLLGREV